MELSQWKKAVQLHVPALEAILENTFKRTYVIEVEETSEKDAGETRQALPEHRYSFAEHLFQSEIIFGFDEECVEGLTGIAKKDEQKPCLMVSRTILDLASAALDAVGIETEIGFEELEEEQDNHKELGQDAYIVTHFRAKPTAKNNDPAYPTFDFWAAISEPNEEQVTACGEKFKKGNPFKNNDYANALAHLIKQQSTTEDTSSKSDFRGVVNQRGQNVEFEDFGNDSTVNNPNEVHNIDILKNVEMDVSVELGRREMPLGHILKLVKGSVIELEKMAGEPVELLVNGHTIAKGDVVVIDEHFGVRISDLMASREHIKELR